MPHRAARPPSNARDQRPLLLVVHPPLEGMPATALQGAAAAWPRTLTIRPSSISPNPAGLASAGPLLPIQSIPPSASIPKTTVARSISRARRHRAVDVGQDYTGALLARPKLLPASSHPAAFSSTGATWIRRSQHRSCDLSLGSGPISHRLPSGQAMSGSAGPPWDGGISDDSFGLSLAGPTYLRVSPYC